MNIQKIKGRRCHFAEGFGPFESVTIGFTIDDHFVNLGEFYFGPNMADEDYKLFKKLEDFVDTIVNELHGNDRSGGTIPPVDD